MQNVNLGGIFNMCKAVIKPMLKAKYGRIINIGSIAPGFIKSEMTDKLDEKQKEAMLSKVPMKRMGTLEDVANGALFLVSPMADYITGTTLHINGGMY